MVFGFGVQGLLFSLVLGPGFRVRNDGVAEYFRYRVHRGRVEEVQ